MSRNHSNFIVVSFGGVGSKFLLKGLLPDRTAKEQQRFHRHWRNPREAPNAHSKIVYMFGDPMDAVVSFFNRREHTHERHGFKVHAGLGRKDWPRQHCRNVQGDWIDLQTNWNLAAFLEHGRDLFRLEEHFDNWLQSDQPDRVLFARYETLWSQVTTIVDFLELPYGVAEKFPPHIPRTSDWRDQPLEVRLGLEALYGAFVRRLSGLPDVFLRGAQAKPPAAASSGNTQRQKPG